MDKWVTESVNRNDSAKITSRVVIVVYIIIHVQQKFFKRKTGGVMEFVNSENEQMGLPNL